jgi:hypothetical protein
LNPKVKTGNQSLPTTANELTTPESSCLDCTLIVISYFTCTSAAKDTIGRTTLGFTHEELPMLKTSYNFPFNARTCATKGRNDIEKSLKNSSKIIRFHANMSFCTNISLLHL